MYTQCPDCTSIFEISPEHLGAAGGMVRCGVCDSTFNALRRLTQAPPAQEKATETVAANSPDAMPEATTGQTADLFSYQADEDLTDGHPLTTEATATVDAVERAEQVTARGEVNPSEEQPASLEEPDAEPSPAAGSDRNKPAGDGDSDTAEQAEQAEHTEHTEQAEQAEQAEQVNALADIAPSLSRVEPTSPEKPEADPEPAAGNQTNRQTDDGDEFDAQDIDDLIDIDNEILNPDDLFGSSQVLEEWDIEEGEQDLEALLADESLLDTDDAQNAQSNEHDHGDETGSANEQTQAPDHEHPSDTNLDDASQNLHPTTDKDIVEQTSDEELSSSFAEADDALDESFDSELDAEVDEDLERALEHELEHELEQVLEEDLEDHGLAESQQLVESVQDTPASEGEGDELNSAEGASDEASKNDPVESVAEVDDDAGSSAEQTDEEYERVQRSTLSKEQPGDLVAEHSDERGQPTANGEDSDDEPSDDTSDNASDDDTNDISESSEDIAAEDHEADASAEEHTLTDEEDTVNSSITDAEEQEEAEEAEEDEDYIEEKNSADEAAAAEAEKAHDKGASGVLTEGVDGTFDEPYDDDASDLKDLGEYLAPGKSLGRRFMEGSLVAVLLGALAAQYVHYNRASLATHPVHGSRIQALYEQLGVELLADWNVDDYRIARHTIVPGDDDNVLKARATVVNNSASERPLPLVRLVLNNRWGDALYGEVFAPEQYLRDASPGRLAGNGRLEVSLDLVHPAPGEEIGYNFDICLDTPAGPDCGSPPVFNE